MMHRKRILLPVIALLFLQSQISAQGLRGAKTGPARGGVQKLELDVSRGDKRNDVEGAIWEFKVMENSEKDRSKRTKMTGRLRIKQTSVFSVGKVTVTDSKASDPTAPGDAQQRGGIRDRLLTGRSGTKPNPGGPQGAGLGNLRAQATQRQGSEPNGTERVGDLVNEKSSEYKFRFDEDDKYPLSGRASVKPDTNDRGGVWIGSYDEFENGKKIKRWRFEMRRVED